MVLSPPMAFCDFAAARTMATSLSGLLEPARALYGDSGEPLKSYQEVEKLSADQPSRALFWHPRSGKTRGAVVAMKARGLARYLVVAPPLAAELTWRGELAMGGFRSLILSGGNLAARAGLIVSFGNGVIVVNTEALAPLREALEKWGPQGVVADESHLFKRPGALRTRALISLGRKAVWRRILSGTPIPNTWGDIFSQFKFLDPTVFGTSFRRFADQYLIEEPFWHRVVGYKNFEEMVGKVHDKSSYVSLEEIGGIEGDDTVQYVPFEPAGERLYESIKKDGVGMVRTYDSAVAILSALQQLSSGFVYSEGASMTTWVDRGKLRALQEELLPFIEGHNPVIVFFHYRAEGEAISKALGKTPHGLLYGPTKDKVGMVEDFQNGKKYDILVVQENTVAHGIKLDRARTAIYFSHGFSSDVYEQTRNRILKVGCRSQHIYLRRKNTVEDFVAEVVKNKRKLMEIFEWLKQ